MEKLNRIHEKIAKRELPRWFWPAVALAVAALLALSVETGRVHAQATTAFRFRGFLVRVISPNRDRNNDVGILCYENPKSSAVSGKIFDLRGAEVAAMLRIQDPNINPLTVVAQCRGKFPPSGVLSNSEALTWDGRSGGSAVAGGVYIYQIQSEDLTVTGTVLVVR